MGLDYLEDWQAMMHVGEQVFSSVGKFLWDYGETIPFLRGGHLTLSNCSVFTDAGRLGLDSEEDHYTPQKVGL